MGPTDEQLVEAFQGGDVSAFDLLVSRWDRKIQGAVYRVVGPSEDVRDITQEAFLKAYRALPLFRKEARFSSWLYQIALNLCRDRLRRSRRSQAEVSLDLLGESGEAPLSNPGPSAVELIEAREISRTVGAAVWALPEDHREVIVLKEYEGLTFQEIADVLGLPVSTVKTRLYRGLGLLRECLERKGIRNPAPLPAPVP
jgi:RNA polymerase sigma-70 factor (ECF subfamily)